MSKLSRLSPKAEKHVPTLTVVSPCVRCGRPTYCLTLGIGGCLRCDPHDPYTARYGPVPTTHHANA